MAYTLAQLAQIERDDYRRAIMFLFLRNSKLMNVVPWRPVSGLQNLAKVVKSLPTGGAFRKIGGTWTESTDGLVEDRWESVYIFGGEMKFDRVFKYVKNVIVDPRVQQTDMKLESMSLDFNNYFINGDHATDVDGFEGLKKRISGMPSRQLIAGCTTTTSANPTAATSDARYFLDAWDKAFQRANGGRCDAIFCNEDLILGFGRIMRYLAIAGSNLLDVTKDTLDREFLTYKGAPLIDTGLKKDQSTEIITNTELDSSGGGTECTSAYFVNFSEDKGLMGIELHPLLAELLGEDSNGPYEMTRIEWPVGLASFGNYGFSRLYSIFDPNNWS